MPPPSKADLWSTGVDETVEVNQRALIDKILARYSGENTIFRELLQNADDAGAEHVQVKFYTEAGLAAADKGEGPSRLPDVKKDPILRYVVCNDGIPFRPEDWKRLKKIAEGNPDEEKIGAFGVGFYSLWSVCDDPFVESGDKWMGFYWKDGKDQLLARSGDLPPSASSSTNRSSSTGNPWTSFSMSLREPTILEGPLDLARFFITSLTFMRTMKRVDMLVDDVKVLEVSKSVKGKERVHRKGLRNTSSAGMMTVTGVDATAMIITAKVMQWLAATGFTPPPLAAPMASLAKPAKAFTSFLTSSFFSRSTPSPAPTPPPPPPPEEDPLEVSTLSREIQIYQADIKVSVSPQFGRELERATKKPPPKTMPASLVFSRGDEEVAGAADEGIKKRDAGAVFSGLCPSLDGEQSAKVFIGQATSQTTGIGGHLAARFIPTVERESIDLVDKHVSHWNKELLWVGGYLSRLIYELEMQDIQTLWSTTSVKDVERRDKLRARGLHAVRFFSYRSTTPSAMVGQGMEAAFYTCGSDNKTMPIISTAGVLPISQVRMPNTDMQKFLPDMPSMTASTIEEAPRFVARLRDQHLLREVSLEDVIKELGAKPLTQTEMVSCLQWWQNVAVMEGYTPQIRSRLLDAAVLVQDSGKIVPLSTIGTFVKPQSSSIPTDMPLPQHTLPYSITKDLKGNSIYTTFGWTELSILQYITFLITPPMSGSAGADPETDVRSSPAFAERVLAMLGRAWQSISANQQTAIALELKDVPCIPTKAGFKTPGEAYFEKNLLFDDLPTISLPKNTAIKGGMEKMLLAIGVRKTVNLQLVFSRLIGGGTWTCQDLMKYLVSVKDTLTPDELARLRQTAAFPLEIETPEGEAKAPAVRRKPNQLYEPVEAMRNLGLPVLDWGEGKWKSNSDEARMLFSLGLRKYPPIDVLLGIAAGRPPNNERALGYLLTNVHTHYMGFEPAAFSGVAFIPAIKPDGEKILAKPGDVFTNPACAILGFAVTQKEVINGENAAKLRVQSDPPMDKLVQAMLSSASHDLIRSREVFEYLATQLGRAVAGSLERLSSAAFIPIKTEKSTRLAKPSEVYFTPRSADESPFKSAFTFVDFGDKANVFLRICGVRSEPSVKDIAFLLLRDPERMLREAGSSDRYLEQLRLLAANWTTFDYSTRNSMKSAPFLLASQLVPRKKAKKLIGSWGGSEDEYDREWVLAKANEITVVDHITMLQYFGQHVLAAPEEQLLETFYEHLGAKSLSSLIKTEYIPHHPSPTPSPQSVALRKHVLERLTIFLAEARRKSSVYNAEWLNKENNFVIQEVRDLKVRYTYRNGRNEYSHHETLYATAGKNAKTGAVVLTISLTTQPDDYDIASALCGVLLKSNKADEALLLYSILSTPLMALKKRGFNVDRILNQQREERLRIQAEAVRERESQAKAGRSGDVDDLSEESDGTAADTTTTLANTSASSSSSSSTKKKGLMEKFRRLSIGSEKSNNNVDRMPSMPGGFSGFNKSPSKIGNALSGFGGFGGAGLGASGITAGGGQATQTTKRPTSQQHIRETVQKAVDASRPETATQISDSRHAVQDVSESQNDYCDLSAQADLILADDMRYGFKLWVPRNTENVQAFLSDKTAVSERFANEVLRPLGVVFKLSPQVLNIFWDNEGPLIAFNRGGAIFCNARYYTAWHDVAVQGGNKNDAFISWYFSIAHELAHNLESAHNSAHEFYFSSIAEEFLVPFSRLLQV